MDENFELENSNEEEITDADFVLSQADKKIHDTKFETKPTTFLKDAMKRFCKNRSSVAAAGILLVIIAMAIIVPLADTNDIGTPVAAARYLPPKWFDNTNGFLDGTGEVSSAILDPKTGLPDSDQYLTEAIVTNGKDVKDAIKVTNTKVSGTSTQVLNYGTGGSYTIKPKETKEGDQFVEGLSGIQSTTFSFSNSDEISLKVTFDKDLYKENLIHDTEMDVSLLFMTTVSDETEIFTLASRQNLLDLGEIIISSFKDSICSSEDGKTYWNGLTSLSQGKLVIALTPTNLASCANSCYIEKIEVSSNHEYDEGDATNIANIAMSSPIEEMKRATSKDNSTNSLAYSSYNGASTDLVDVTVSTGSFRYDYYQGVYGIKTMTISSLQLESYINKGYLNFEFTGKGVNNKTVDASRYEILNDTYSPIREILTETWVETKTMGATTVRKEVTAKVSMYRYYYDQGRLGKCAMPKFIFGTNQNGLDFFKLVFSGLLTSLGLGLLSASINILIGLLWGSVSGYFGGWTDIIMERFTEILGGMPWIVLMTIIVLKWGSSFWTLLIALCLTGWMGVSGTTRSQFYRYKGREYVLASRTLGASDARLIFKHILPNGVGTIVTGAILMVPSVIFTEANVAYLLPGLLQYESGITSFGITLSDAQNDLTNYPYMIVSASLVMVLIMIAFNLFGNGLRDAFNPSLKGADE